MHDLLDRRLRLDLDLRRANPDIPHGLQAIVQKCLSFGPDDRYPDAQVLAEDLERFLSRRPLLFATNPSRWERVRNAVVRHRRTAAATAAAIMAGVFIGYLAQPAIKKGLQPPVQQLPKFIDAAAAVERGAYDEASRPLRELAAQYPDEPLVLTYLAIVQAMSKDFGENEAQVSFAKALSRPDHNAVLRRWFAKHPELTKQVGEFVRAQSAEINGKKNPQNPGDLEVERRYFDVFRNAVGLALEAAPESDALQLQMAMVEEYDHKFEAAYRRITDLITRRSSSEASLDRSTLVDWTTRRARIGIHWATDLTHPHDRADRTRASQALRESATSLDTLDPEVGQLAGNPHLTTTGVNLVYNFFWILTEARLARGNDRASEGLKDQSATDFRLAQQSFVKLRTFRDDHPYIKRGDLDELRKRVYAARGVTLSRAE
jgi:hypothetical protein